MSPTKEQMALEALLKIMTCFCQSGTTIDESITDYANEALMVNGWGIGVNELGLCHPVRLIGEKAPDVDYAVLGAKKLMSDVVGNKQ